jgi:ketosteroid isomerase-like protein
MHRRHPFVCGIGLALAALAAACSSRPTTRLDEFVVRNRLDEIDRAVLARDVDAVVGFLAEDAVVQLTTHVYGGARTDTLDPAQYRNALAEAYQRADEIEYQRTTKSIAIAEDGRMATVESLVLEGLRQERRWVRTRTRERAVFEVRDDAIVVTAVVGDSTITEGTLEDFVFIE